MSENEIPLTENNVNDGGTPDDTDDNNEEMVVQSATGTTPPQSEAETAPPAPSGNGANDDDVDDMKPRLERLGGEPAPDITPEEFARLQQSGQIHIDPRGRVRSARPAETDAGVSLRKRRAWYADSCRIFREYRKCL